MSRNVKDSMVCILDVLKGFVAEEDKHRIKVKKCNIKANVDDETPVIDFVAKAKCHTKYVQNCFLSVFEYNEVLYLMVPSQSEELYFRLGLNIVEDVVIYQGVGMLAISQKALPLSNDVGSLNLIEAFLGNDIQEVFFSEILDLFEKYIVLEIKSDRFAIEYEEDIDRLYALMNLDNSKITLKSRICFENLLLLQSSRGLSVALENSMNSSSWNYSYLQLYHCLEYLFIIRQAMMLKDKYNIKDNISLDIAVSGRLRTTENENLLAVLEMTPELQIENFYNDLIRGSGMFESEENKKDSVAKYIYRLRCNIAHLRFEQEHFEVEGKWNTIYERLTEIVYVTYQQNDADILKMCSSRVPWHTIDWKGN